MLLLVLIECGWEWCFGECVGRVVIAWNVLDDDLSFFSSWMCAARWWVFCIYVFAAFRLPLIFGNFDGALVVYIERSLWQGLRQWKV